MVVKRMHQKWAAWLVLWAMLFNLAAPNSVWAAEAASSAPQQSEQLLAEGPALDEMAVSEQTLPKSDEPPALTEEQPPSETADVSLEYAQQKADAPLLDGLEAAAPLASAEKAARVLTKAPEETMTVTIGIDSFVLDGLEAQLCTLSVPVGATVLEAMQLAQKQGVLQMNVQDGSWGAYIDEINGFSSASVRELFPDIPAGVYPGWVYRVNGEMADVGVGQYVLNEGDAIEWTFSLLTDGMSYPDWEFFEKKAALPEKLAAVEALAQSADGATSEHLLALVADGRQWLSNAEAAIESVDLMGQYVVSQLLKDKAALEALDGKLEQALAGYVAVEEVVINPPGTLYTGESRQLTAQVLPQEASEPELKWEVLYSGAEGTTISEDGLLTVGSKPGKLVVQATAIADQVSSKGLPLEVALRKDPAAEARLALERAADWLKASQGDFTQYDSANSNNVAFLLARLNRLSSAESGAYYEALTEYVEEQGATLQYVTQWSGLICAVSALGYSPRDVGGVNYLEQLLAYDLNTYCDAAVCSSILKALRTKGDTPTAYSAEEVAIKLLSYRRDRRCALRFGGLSAGKWRGRGLPGGAELFERPAEGRWQLWRQCVLSGEQRRFHRAGALWPGGYGHRSIDGRSVCQGQQQCAHGSVGLPK